MGYFLRIASKPALAYFSAQQLVLVCFMMGNPWHLKTFEHWGFMRLCKRSGNRLPEGVNWE